MDKIVIQGGRRLKGEVRVSGAKNAALPILASAILSGGTSVFRNVPKLMDVRTMAKLMRILGAEIDDADKSGYALSLNTDGIHKFHAPYELVKT
ncbi:MAG: murA, partial [Myxococcales bacterium]|nr:murA [Myxococcales bacterium]